MRSPCRIAIVLWHALARFAGRFARAGTALLVDIGSTTTDLIPLERGHPRSVGTTDLSRLLSGELVYKGVERSPVCALVQSVPYPGQTCRVAQEHFATNLVRGRLLGLARGWGQGSGPIALLACPAGERHDLPLLLFGISLRASGWRIVFLGADVPIPTIEEAVRFVAPAVVVLATTLPEPLLAVETELATLAARVPVAIGGRAADAILAERVGAIVLDGDPASAAAALAARIVA